MIENIVVTKLGSESSNAAHTIFSSTVAWSDTAAELIVYRNGVLQNKNVDFTVLDTYNIQFNFPLDSAEQVQLLVTRMSSEDLNRDKLIEIDRAVKKLDGKTQTSLDKRVFEEELSSPMIIHKDDVWSDFIDPEPLVSSASGITRLVQTVLDEDVSVRNSSSYFFYYKKLGPW